MAGHGKIRSALSKAKSIYDLETELAKIEDETVAEIQKELREARQATIDRLARLTGTFDIAQAQQILAELQRQQQQFSLVWTDLFKEELQKALEAGEEAAVAITKGTSIEVSVRPFISTEFLNVAAQTLPTLIKGLTDEWYADIGRILRQAVLAQLTPMEVIRQIGEVPPFMRFDLATGKYVPLTDAELRAAMDAKGPFAKLFRRMEAIMRTEIGRIAQTANYLTLLSLAKTDPQYQKEWLAVLDNRTRHDHAMANGQRRPVDQPFNVGGYEMQFPLDPRGPASETVNCRCMMQPWHPAFEGIEGPPTVPDHLTPTLPGLPVGA